MKKQNRIQRKNTTTPATQQAPTYQLLTDEQLAMARKQSELDGAINQAEAFCALLEHHLYQPSANEYNDSIKSGIVELSAATFKRLKAISVGAYHTYRELPIATP